jgi:hypothetical protein
VKINENSSKVKIFQQTKKRAIGQDQIPYHKQINKSHTTNMQKKIEGTNKVTIYLKF